MQTQYEIINIDTKEIIEATNMTIGDGFVTFGTVNGEVRFENPLNDGNYSNDTYVARQVETKETPNQDGTVTDEGVEVPN